MSSHREHDFQKVASLANAFVPSCAWMMFHRLRYTLPARGTSITLGLTPKYTNGD